jgi:hypothetical protein
MGFQQRYDGIVIFYLYPVRAWDSNQAMVMDYNQTLEGDEKDTSQLLVLCYDPPELETGPRSFDMGPS